MHIKIHIDEAESIYSRFNETRNRKEEKLSLSDEKDLTEWVMIKNDINFFDLFMDMAEHSRHTSSPYIIISANEFNRMRDYL